MNEFQKACGWLVKRKCKSCPYYLGYIKCVHDPCPACKESGSKQHPFPVSEIKCDGIADQSDL